MRRLTLTLLLCVLPLSALAASAAADTSSCTGTTGKDVALCSIDTQKRWVREEQAFMAQLEKERTEWHLTHDVLGITPERTKELQAFTLEQQRKAQIFRRRLTSERQALEKSRQKKEVTVPRAADTARPNATAARMDQGKKICSKFTSETEFRACMKPYLRIDVYGHAGVR